jgi:hypothetical protein
MLQKFFPEHFVAVGIHTNAMMYRGFTLSLSMSLNSIAAPELILINYDSVI